MSFELTQPARIDLPEGGGPWAPFRVSDPRRQLATLRALCRGDVPLSLGRPGGPLLETTLWAVDGATERLHFSGEADPAQRDALLAGPDAWVAGYLDDAKVQIALQGLSLERATGRELVLSARPASMFHLPRRRAVRVRRPGGGPAVRLRHPQAGTALELTVFDISIGGCALRQPPGSVPLAAGQLLREVEFELDAFTFLFADLQVHHVTPERGPGGATRVGCEWVFMADSAREALHGWIRKGRRRRELVRLDLD